jgi:hypothetical protein
MIDARAALIVVDVQTDFCPGGRLPVAGGDEIVPLVNALGRRFSTVVLTQDWHPARHSSFASSHDGKVPFETITMPYGPQVLWPDHCVQGSDGATFHPGLDLAMAQAIIRKGYRREVDSYSGFVEADRRARRLSPGARCRPRRGRGPRHRFLRRLDGAGRRPPRLRDARRRGGLPRHRPRRLARPRLGGDGGARGAKGAPRRPD